MNYHVTSTPLITYKSGTPSPSRLTPNPRSPKYLIASPPCGSPLRRQSDRGVSPMLNSNVNVSLYTNTQSPGLASRIVQYDRAQNGRSPTYNRKFGSPGLFPIVHLYKQNLPVASPKPKKVTVKIAPPDDLSMYNHIDHSIIISENAGIKFHEQSVNEAGTRSVLDALKEISRKRIHATAEVESTSPEGGLSKRNKRIPETSANPTNQSNSITVTPQIPPNPSNNNKRAREESPTDANGLSSSSPSNSTDKNNPKRYCSIDPVTASFTSANLRLQELRKSQVKPPEEYREDLPQSPVRKVQQVNVDTQTIDETIETPRENLTETLTESSNSSETAKTPSLAKESSIISPLFDPRPLEVLRRNKLAALLGAISGEVPLLEKAASFHLDQPPTPPVTSILSNSGFNVDSKVSKEPKHVTFDLPPPMQVPTPNPLMALTQTTTALIMPISSAMVAPISSSTTPMGGHSFGTGACSTVHITSTSTPTAMSSVEFGTSPPKLLGGFKFDLIAPTIGHNAAGLNSVPSVGLNSVPSVINSTASVPDAVQFGFQFKSVSSEPSKGLEAVPKQPVIGFGPTGTKPGTNNDKTMVPSPSFSFANQAPLPTALAASNDGFSIGTALPPPPLLGSTVSATTISDVPKPFSFGTISSVPLQTTSKSAESIQINDLAKPVAIINPASTAPLYNGTALPSNMFSKPNLTFQTDSNVTTSNNSVSVGFPLTTTASTKFGTNNIFGATTTANVNSTFSFGGGVPLSTAATFGGTADKVVPTFGTANIAVTTAPGTNIFGSAAPFGAPAVVSTANSSFIGFGTAVKDINQQPGVAKFGEITVTTIANNPPPNLFSFGGGTSTDTPQQNSAFNIKDQFGTGAPKLTFGNFGTANNSTFGNTQTEVPPNQTISNGTFSFGANGNTFANTAANASTAFGSPFNAPPAPVNFGTPQQTKLFSFGTATAVPKAADSVPDNGTSGVFAFGNPVKAQTGGFNFASANSAGFGAGVVAPAPVMFGAPQAMPSFNVVGGFNAPGMFSIGSGTSSGPSRPRTQLKNKRRT